MKRKISILALMIVSVAFTSCWDFNRDQDEKDAISQGRQILFKSESSKKAKIEEAKADYESAKLNAETRLIEASSKAKSIEIISNAIKTNPDYTKYQLIESMKNAQKVYIPTEAGLPIIERR